MTEAKDRPQDLACLVTDAMSLLKEAEAEAAEAEALAVAARARARAVQLRREALALSEATDTAADDAGEKAAAAPGAQSTVSSEVLSRPATRAGEPVEPSNAQAARSRPARWRQRLPSLSATSKVAAVVLIMCFGGASGYMEWQHRDTIRQEQRAAQFLAGARQGVVNMTSLDFNKAKEDVQRMIDGSTGEFRDDFQQRAKDFTSVVEQSKVITEGTVKAAAVESMDEHSASVLVLASSTVTNSAGAKDEPRAWRLRVTVTEDGGQYKMSKVEVVP